MNNFHRHLLSKPAKKLLDGLEHVPGESCGTRKFSSSYNKREIWEICYKLVGIVKNIFISEGGKKV